jgi:hypothetical protein
VITLLLALAILLALTAIGAGPSALLLGRRGAWMTIAPIVGLAVVVVLAEVPAWFFGARAWAWPVAIASMVFSSVLLWKRRTWSTEARSLELRSLWLLGVPMLLAAWAVLPYYRVDTLTTLSEHNHDYMFYLALEADLVDMGYGAPSVLGDELFPRFGALLRRGGWRAGICTVSAFFAGLFRLEPHQVDGALWSAIYASTPTTLLGAFGLVVPRSSRRARLFLVLWAIACGPAWMLLRWSFASHIAALPLIVLFAASLWRGLREATWHRRALAALLLAATVSVFADASPYVLLIALAATFAAPTWRARWRRVRHWRWALLAAAVMPFTLWRIALSLHSLAAVGVQAPLLGIGGDLARLLPEALGQHVFGTELGRLSDPVSVLMMASSAAGLVLLCVGLARLRSRSVRVGVLVPVLIGLSTIVALSWAGPSFVYAGWKLAMTMSPFVAIGLAAALDRVHWIGASTAAVLLLSAQVATLARAIDHAPDPIGVLPVHEQLADRLAVERGELYLVGHHSGSVHLHDEHALTYLLDRRGRALRAHIHPISYIRTSWPEPDFARGGSERTIAVIVDPNAAIVVGPTVPLASVPAPYTALELGPGAFVANLGFDRGFHDVEHDDQRAFRWADRVSLLHVDLLQAGDCLEMELRGIDDGLGPWLAVDEVAVLEHTLAPLDRSIGPGSVVPITRDWTWQRLRCAAAPGPMVLSLRYLGGRRPEQIDARSIFVAFGRARIVRFDAD